MMLRTTAQNLYQDTIVWYNNEIVIVICVLLYVQLPDFAADKRISAPR